MSSVPANRPRVLALHMNGGGRPVTFGTDTLLRGVLGVEWELAPDHALSRFKVMRQLFGNRYEHMGYGPDWLEGFRRCEALDVTECSITNLVRLRGLTRRLQDFDLVVVLHTALGDNVGPLRRLRGWLDRRNAPLLVLVGNEYEQMAAKIGLLADLGAEFVGTQLPLATGRWLYGEVPGLEVLPAPHAVDAHRYTAAVDAHRPIDLGFMGARYPAFIGDDVRNRFIDALGAAGIHRGWNVALNWQNQDRRSWAARLASSRVVPGAESGSYFLDRNGAAIDLARQYWLAHPDAPIGDIRARFFAAGPWVSGKAISSRHFEQAAAGSCQALVAGSYNGILQPGEHYISVAEDLSDIGQAIERLDDQDHCRLIASAAQELVLRDHTYDRRVRQLVDMTLAAHRPALAGG